MAYPNIFNEDTTAKIVDRIQKLTPDTQPQWGKMNVSQMLAHCCVTYQYVYEPQKFKKPNFLMSWVLKTFVKNAVCNEVPYKKNTGTAPDFIIKDNRDFETEKQRLISFVTRAQKDGTAFFDGKESHSFGKLSINEWNNMFYKHLDHHLGQFGV
jgi:uncharacterized damage-inducible protein DinB